MRDTMRVASEAVVEACGSVVDELAAGALGDERLNARRDRVLAVLERQPDRGFPDACADDAEVEALYRFLRNPRVSPAAILAPHVAATAARCAAVGEVLVLHDTTDMVFAGTAPRVGLTRLGPGRQGFWVHAAVAVSADGLRAPLGVLSLQSYGRPTPPVPRPRRNDRARFAAPTKESRRWLAGVTTVRGAVGPATSPIHVMDRDADSYATFAALIAHQERFVIRLQHDRCVVAPEGTTERLTASLAQAAVVCERAVPLAPRQDSGRTLSARTRHPARARRVATLQVAAQRVDLPRPPHVATTAPATLSVHLVWVREREAPPDVEPVDWRLVTTEPVATTDQILRVVDWYRTRWMIEEYFKALKTGCAYERRQLESLQTLRVALALLAPIAWRLLLLRHVARVAPELSAAVAVTSRHVHLLRATRAGAKLPAVPTVTDVLAAIARLGGHLRQNGPPGWLVLARGFQKLQTMELGWIAATQR